MAKDRSVEKKYHSFNEDMRKYINFEDFSRSLHLKLTLALCAGLYSPSHKKFRFTLRSYLTGQIKPLVWDFTDLVENLRGTWNYHDPHFYRFWLDKIASEATNAAWCNVYAQFGHLGDRDAVKKANQAANNAIKLFK